ncbi:unnamed protein product, partial [Callosobruchus maculatus]
AQAPKKKINNLFIQELATFKERLANLTDSFVNSQEWTVSRSGARLAIGHRRVAVLRQVGAGASLPHRQLHAGGIPGRRSLQEGGPRRQPELPVADQGR